MFNILELNLNGNLNSLNPDDQFKLLSDFSDGILGCYKLQLRKFIKNRRKIRKIQIQFCWVPGVETYLF
jgi:hypothetical protein